MSTRDLDHERPQMFLSDPVRVLALRYDGSIAGVAAVTAWVDRIVGRFSTAVLDRDVVILAGSGGATVRVRPGEFLVLSDDEWITCSGAEFLRGHRRVPREMPIFDDGEVA